MFYSQSQLNEELIQNVVKSVFIDWRPKVHKEYSWSHPPKLEGQFGVPIIVDKILGTTFPITCFINKKYG